MPDSSPQEQGYRGVGVDRGDPEPVPSPFDVGYSPHRNEKAEVFKCEGMVYEGYRRACPDFQRMPNAVKWGVKLSGWEGRYFDSKNIALRPADKESLCKWSASAAVVTACLTATVGCVVGEVVTIGGITIPCGFLAAFLCVAPSEAVHNILDCHEWAWRKP